MTRRKNTNKQIDNPEFLKELIQNHLQEYLEQEVSLHIGALPYERTVDRRGHRNGYKPRQLNTRVGKLFLSIPQTRDVHLVPSCLSATGGNYAALSRIEGSYAADRKTVTPMGIGHGINRPDQPRQRSNVDNLLTDLFIHPTNQCGIGIDNSG